MGYLLLVHVVFHRFRFIRAFASEKRRQVVLDASALKWKVEPSFDVHRPRLCLPIEYGQRRKGNNEGFISVDTIC